MSESTPARENSLEYVSWRNQATWPPPDDAGDAWWARAADRMAPIAAWGTVALFLAVPILAVYAGREPSPLWIVWTVISLWGALDSRQIAAAAFPGWPLRNPSRLIGLLAALNLLVSVYAMLLALAPGA